MLLLVFSFLSFSWEFTKILTYQSRFFSRTQVLRAILAQFCAIP